MIQPQMWHTYKFLTTESHYHIVTNPLKARIAKPEEMAIPMKWLCKHISRATKSCDRSNRLLCESPSLVEDSPFLKAIK
jgi:hypothetical protein